MIIPRPRCLNEEAVNVNDVASVAAVATPYITGAVAAYGASVLGEARDEVADATVSLGRRLLRRIFGVHENQVELPQALRDLAAEPDDPDAVATVRLQIRKRLEADAILEADVRRILAGTGVTIISHGKRSVSAQVINAPVATGDNSTIRHSH
jgi:hypothetical protein